MTDIAVSTGGFTPEIWSEKININLDNYGAYNDIVNRKYEGEIKSKGDRVHFDTLGSMTVRTYNPNATGFSGLQYEDPTGTKQTLIVDQQKYIGFLVDDIKQVQSNLNLVNDFTNRMAIAFSNTKDAYIHGLAVAGAGTKLHSASALTISKDNVWTQICKLYETLARKNAITKNGLDYQGKRPALVCTPEYMGVLLQASQFFTNAFGEKVLRTGQIGHIGPFDVFLDTNIATDKSGTGTAATYSQTIVALTSDAITYAEQITKTETLRDKDTIGDYVRSLMVYGGLVANADCIVTDKITISGLGA